jgi:hypothetical protein
MSNSYKYIDHDYTYTDPKTGILRNLHDISDPNVLHFVKLSVEVFEPVDIITSLSSIVKTHPFDPMVNEVNDNFWKDPYHTLEPKMASNCIVNRQFDATKDICKI